MGEILEVLPCIADPEKLRVIAKINVGKDFKEVMPYVAKLIPNSSYVAKKGVITFKKGARIITILSDGVVGMTQIRNLDEAMELLDETERKVKEAYERKDEIDISKPAGKVVVSAMDVYNYLPRTNCRECGEQTCMAFAVKLLNGEKSLSDCKPLFLEEKYTGVKESLISILLAAGYEV